jgi:hypothetical protein
MADNELRKFANEDIEAVAEDTQLDEFKADGENSSIADPIATKSNKRPADKEGKEQPGPQGGKTTTPGTEPSGNMLNVAKGKAPARKADKSGSDVPQSNKVATPGQGSVKEDIDAIFDGEELSEELREKAETIFEAAVNARVNSIQESLEEQAAQALAEATEEIKEDLSGKVDNYLNYVAEEWMKENEVAVESSLKVEVAESFMAGIAKLMEAHNIKLPEDVESDVLTDLQNKVTELEAKLEEETVEKIGLSTKLQEAEQKIIFAELTDDLAETQIEKIRALSEGLDYDNVEDYSKKITMLKESYFGNKTASVDLEDDEPVELDEEVKLPKDMQAYASAISRTIRK